MGAYHIGAFQALREAAFEPDWVCGISMGAINGAIIAGNAPEQRLQRLETFWTTISRPSMVPRLGGTAVRTWEHMLSFAEALTLGQPGFFAPRPTNPYLAPPGIAATSFYDTAPLYGTLAELVDFDGLNQPGTRLSVGATDVEAGTLVFFDNQRMQGLFGPQHVVASGSLPPGFPATPIDGKLYWDGGSVERQRASAGHDGRRAVARQADPIRQQHPRPRLFAGSQGQARRSPAHAPPAGDATAAARHRPHHLSSR
jgi:NTE family protein